MKNFPINQTVEFMARCEMSKEGNKARSLSEKTHVDGVRKQEI